ncbi:MULTISPECIES: fimbrial protein [Zymobacter]|uniref:P pilus assembly protein, pilin FimA n=1 Tax=Zymobacter palmae TaxID=33074 RepID=A0A348HBI9_9GAMM|nr:fimbrial protein [Zymobacter palmae]BBG28991.1 P pilus assembly protein, pilin FimA [Zymobacter palmae]
MKTSSMTIAAAVSTLSLAMPIAAAAEGVLGGGTITFQGAVTDTTCTINGHNSSSLTVSLPPISVEQANTMTQRGLIPVNRQPFQLDLSDCAQAGSARSGWSPTIRMSFSGPQISSDGKYLRNEMPTRDGRPSNIGIAITEQGHPDELIKLNTPYDTRITASSTAKTPQPLRFYANYYKTGNDETRAGGVRTLVTYALSYN